LGGKPRSERRWGGERDGGSSISDPAIKGRLLRRAIEKPEESEERKLDLRETDSIQ